MSSLLSCLFMAEISCVTSSIFTLYVWLPELSKTKLIAIISSSKPCLLCGGSDKDGHIVCCHGVSAINYQIR